MFTIIFKSFVFATMLQKERAVKTVAMFCRETCRVNLLSMKIIYIATDKRLEQESALCLGTKNGQTFTMPVKARGSR